MALTVASIGYLVPCPPATTIVHSVFARACNVRWRDGLLTLVAPGASHGPAVMRLARGGPSDLRRLLEAGERLQATPAGWRSARVAIDWSHAAVWRPSAPDRPPGPASLAANLQRAHIVLAQRAHAAAGVIEAEGAPALAALEQACRVLDAEAAERSVHRLVGWGEGLTPAGDDVLTGVMAAFDAPLFAAPARRRFRDALAAACVARVCRTTAIAAHQLRLAAAGHHGEAVLRVRDALLGAHDPRVLDAALERALAIGATSGAATVAGVVAGLRAWHAAPNGAGRESA